MEQRAERSSFVGVGGAERAGEPDDIVTPDSRRRRHRPGGSVSELWCMRAALGGGEGELAYPKSPRGVGRRKWANETLCDVARSSRV